MIGLIETSGEILKQVSQARIAVRLAYGDQLPLPLHGPRGFQHGGNLNRVVPVIINDARRRLPLDGGPFAHLRKAPLHTAELAHRCANLFIRRTQFQRHSDRRQGVLHIVLARHRQGQPFNHAWLCRARTTQGNIEMRAGQVGVQIDGPHICLAVEAISDAPAVCHPRGQPLHFRVVRTQDGKSVERQVLDEGIKRLAQFFHAAIMVHMFRVDIRDHGAGRVQLGEGSIAFVAFDHHPVALARLVVRAIGMDDAAIDDGRVDVRTIQQRRDHAGRRCLAMRSGDTDRVFQARDLGQHIGTAHNRNAGSAGGVHFGISGFDRRGDDDGPGTLHIFGLVANEDLCAALSQTLDIVGFTNIRTLNLIAHRDHHIRNAGHANAADANNMRRAKVKRSGRGHA